MAREIKFRAWNKSTKYMEDVDGSNLYIADNELYEVFAGSYAYETTFEKRLVTDRYDLMQYIGLTDKNGKEIYEGDLIKRNWKCFDKQLSTLRVVGFKNGSFVSTNIPNQKQRFNTFSLFDTEEKKPILTDWEVIGNIYSNPELLGGESSV